MRIQALALAAASTAVAGMMVMAPAHASASTADRGDLPTYVCIHRGPAPLIYPAMLHGIHCEASNGAPTGGDFAPGPFRFVFHHEEGSWICDSANPAEFPHRVMAHRCFMEN